MPFPFPAVTTIPTFHLTGWKVGSMTGRLQGGHGWSIDLVLL